MHKRILKYQGTLALALLLAAGLMMQGCGTKSSGGSSSSSTNTSSGSSNTTLAYTNGDGLPELTALPTVASSVTRGGSFTVGVPVDSDATGVISVELKGSTGIAATGTASPTGTGAQTVNITVNVGAGLATGTYQVLFSAYNAAYTSFSYYTTKAYSDTRYTLSSCKNCNFSPSVSTLTNPVITITVN